MSENTSIDLPAGVTLEDRHGFPALVIELERTSAVIQLDGAHLTSWVPSTGEDLLWMSPTSEFGPGKAIRGGVPLVGPWFGPGRDLQAVPPHGWLRTHRWEVESVTPALADGTAQSADDAGEGQQPEAVDATLRLEGADPSGSGTSARLRVGVSPSALTIALTITAGDAPLELEAALHTYFAVGDAEKLSFEGFAGSTYLDSADGLTEKSQEGEPRIDGEVDRVYAVTGPIRVEDRELGRSIEIASEGSTKTVLWNPGAAKAGRLPDMPDEAFPEFVCVETAAAKDGFVALAPGEAHTISARYTLAQV
ncbi:D-hexose-6-phosphate mutarotase [Brachybacterium sp. JHP9]|uniref:Putative glucose-6-phosphate 1-epimerase n=1 Tax=Brachybacterium equifaecis TaxID=2910770 RepID=A0ABT0R241_9MICO|nr:D-hexose-6-phosphate mutarotase [Brachybacterium equifaecis]MCL6423458.1 D-hexose-6-phosphate mutarotase [Brachybacterium equifaecis]